MAKKKRLQGDDMQTRFAENLLQKASLKNKKQVNYHFN